MSVQSSRFKVQGAWRCLAWICLAFILTGCASSRSTQPSARGFDFPGDTFIYANELVWEYYFDDQGKWTSRPREPKPDYTHHCFVVARSAKQFFLHARFDPTKPTADAESYRRAIRDVVSRSPRSASGDREKIVVPGYANLREFSESQEALLKAECGGAWQSYLQRGHWRMIFPFSRHHQEKTARKLAASVKHNQPAVAHLVRFPSLKINHAVLLFDVTETDKELLFATYDPNAPDKPVTMIYDRASRQFRFPTNFYFPGGRVDVYEIYHGCRH